MLASNGGISMYRKEDVSDSKRLRLELACFKMQSLPGRLEIDKLLRATPLVA